MDSPTNHGWDKCPPNNFVNYVNKCKLFATNNDLFINFKRDIDYQKILEGGEIVVGDMAISNIINKDKFAIALKYLNEFKENDIYGNPILQTYKELGAISPSTLRYINTSIDIDELVGDFSPKTIIEVGGGYGGLCKTLSVLYNFDVYILVDLPEVIELCKVYISKFPNLKNRVKFLTSLDNNVITDVDLFISDSAIAECSLEYQSKYIDLYIINSKYSYVTFNTSHIVSSNNEIENYKHRLKDKHLTCSSIDDKILFTHTL